MKIHDKPRNAKISGINANSIIKSGQIIDELLRKKDTEKYKKIVEAKLFSPPSVYSTFANFGVTLAPNIIYLYSMTSFYLFARRTKMCIRCGD